MKNRLNIGINMITSNETLRGTDRYITEILHQLSTMDKTNQYFIFYAHWQRFAQPLKASNFQFIQMSPPKGTLLKAFWQALIFPKVVKKYNLNVLHYTNPIPILKRHCPIVVTIHDLAEFIQPTKYGALKSYAKRLFVLLCIKKANFIITVSDTTKRAILDLLDYTPESIDVTLEGISQNLSVDNNDGEYIFEKYHIPRNYILYVGVIEKTKQVESIVKAFSRLDDSLQRNYAIVIAGNKGNAYEEVKATIRNCELEKKVFFLGYVQDNDLKYLYKKAKVFVFPSLIEGFGLPVLEAMGHGIPVIASDIPVISEVVGDAAVLVDPYDITALRDAMSKILLDEELRNSLITKSLERIKDFSWENTARKTLEIYRKLAGMNNEPSV
ncbi:MAG: glycosyltransferase family 1 protein [Candidatus Brocadia sp. AMX2]|uniref:Glycosyltransferase n=1 Tax=Candidatus Brocadia sinica JPN1 TaxID=1197129 RepID=A0ABQ0JWP0_9BACT|nr:MULTISPECIES: glycosyltransferase family 1 protein [Brocadia]MBC6931187.1 glycosyltransferase family 1 protein [Candidatus Brocadia sp.]MBL1167413.1 glycosyltransferase family 1 protein [Candidatus Brocadia sp. AMX1]NOG41114.1 glycosyltransferase family 4 protein [Planctomycetota bacterium]GIK14672.1 MAG: glycosyl transferase [Candidatus Brocadia sinica]KAA0244712.1 MAG: glycosyltransferase family 1 protein [Candidatus Brocadia sp. AMX2]